MPISFYFEDRGFEFTFSSLLIIFSHKKKKKERNFYSHEFLLKSLNHDKFNYNLIRKIEEFIT